MEYVNDDPPMVRNVVRSGALARDPLMLFDVGCGLGIDDAWRLFEPSLVVHGFDPQVDEIERLRAKERNPEVAYHAMSVGLPDEHPFVVRRLQEQDRESQFNPWPRLSTAQAVDRVTSAGPTELDETNDWSRRKLAAREVSLSEFVREEGIDSIDIVKTDTDGRDLEVLHSLAEDLARLCVLGVVVEVPYIGSEAETSNTFHNVDRLLRKHGFHLWTLTVNRYSRAALPAPFAQPALAETTWGQAIWGDIVYLRDAVGPVQTRFGELSPTKLLKLACLCELFRTPDAAAEILVERRETLAPLVDVDRLLDALTPRLGRTQVGYSDYVVAFEADPTSFYPDAPRSPLTSPRARRWSSLRRTVRRVRRALR